MAYRGIILMIHVSNEEGKGKKNAKSTHTPFHKKDCAFEVKTVQIIDLQYCSLCF